MHANLITHAAADADDRFEPARLTDLPLILRSDDQSCGAIEASIALDLYDDVPFLGVMDVASDPPSEQRQITRLSGQSSVDRDTRSVIQPGGQIGGSWGVFGANNGGLSHQTSAGLLPASGADGRAGGPVLRSVNRWMLWVDLNADGQRQSGERFDSSDASTLMEAGPDSGLRVPGFGRFKFWDTDANQPAAWAFKADDQAAPGAFSFEVTVVDGDGDQDRQLHDIVIDENPPLQQRPDVNLFLLMDNSTSMNAPDPSTAKAKHDSRLEAQNRLAFLTLEQALREAGYALQSADGTITNFDDNVISAIFQTGSESLAEILEDFEFVDRPDDGQLPGRLSVHAIRYGYLVSYETVTFTNASTNDGKVVAEDVLLTATPDTLYGNSIEGNSDWSDRGLPPPSSDLDLLVDPLTGRSNLYSGTEMLGALQGVTHLLEQQVQTTAAGSTDLNLVAMFTDGRPERRPWWDHRPEYGSDGITIPLPKPLGGDASSRRVWVTPVRARRNGCSPAMVLISGDGPRRISMQH